MITVLTILPEGFEEIEAVTPIDIWRRAGWKVTTASLSGKHSVTGRSNITLKADTTLSAIGPESVFDLVFLPGGPGVARLRASPEVLEIIGSQVAADKWIAAICAAPLVLKDAGLIAGRRFTAHPSTATELPEALRDENVVVDSKIITSRGAGTALPFAIKTIECLEGEKPAQDVSVSICA